MCTPPHHIALTPSVVFSARTVRVGTGALRIAFELLSKFSKPNTPLLYLPKPTYANHAKILSHGGFTHTMNYRYVDFKTNSLDEEGLLADLRVSKGPGRPQI